MKQMQHQNGLELGRVGVFVIALLLNCAVVVGANAQFTTGGAGFGSVASGPVVVDGYQNEVQLTSPLNLSFVEVPDFATKELGNAWDFAESECDMVSGVPVYVSDLSLSEGVGSIGCYSGSILISPTTSCTSGCALSAYLLFGGDASFRLAPVLRSNFVSGFRDTPKSGRQYPIDADAYSLLSLKSGIADYNSQFRVKWLQADSTGGPLLSNSGVSSLALTSKSSMLMGPDNILLLDLKNPSASNFNVLSSNNADWRGKVVSFGFEKGDGASAAFMNFDWVRLVTNGPPYITLSWTHTLSDGILPLTSDTAINEYLSEVNVQIKTHQVGESTNTNFSVIKEMAGDVACVEGSMVPGQRVCRVQLPVALFPAGEYSLAIEIKRNVIPIFSGAVGLSIAPYADQPKVEILSPAVAGSEISADTTSAGTTAIPGRLSDSDRIWNMDNISDDGTLDLFNNVTDSVRTVIPGTQGVFREILGLTWFDIDVDANAASNSTSDTETTRGEPFANSLNFLLGTNYWKSILSSDYRYLTVGMKIDDDLGSNFLNLAERFGRGYTISPAYHNRPELMVGIDRYQYLYPGRRVYSFDLWDSSTSHIGRRWGSSTWLNLLLAVGKATGINGAGLDFARLTRNCVPGDGSCPLTLRLKNAAAAMDAEIYLYRGGFSDTSPTLLGRVALDPNVVKQIDLRVFDSTKIPVNVDSFFEIRLLSSDGVSVLDSFRSDIPVRPVSTNLALRKTPVDFDGDGRSDEFVYRRNTAAQTGLYYQRLSSTTRPIYRKWIEAGDEGKYSPVTGDFDGDTKTDVALIFPQGGELVWYVYLSGSGKVFGKTWGRVGDVVVVGDAMGSVGDEMGIYRTTSEGKGQWAFYDLKTGNTNLWQGLAGIPVAGDYNGDGKIEQGVIATEGRKLVWKTLKKGAKKTDPLKRRYQTRILGAVGDIPVVGDWNGDGKSDKAIYRASTGTWFIMTDEAAGRFMTVKWGGASYLPVVGDYNGDGLIEPTVYNRSTGVWFHRYHNDEWHKVKLGKSGDYLSCNGRVVTLAGCQ